ncbi:MAG: ketoacyl-ACP synthase III [Phycisphaerales bacterium]|nr:ketoacyl-ACP synthase III [Phycisphaerales bacterium]
MKLDWPVEIAGTGGAAPAQVVTNAEFAARLETSDDWIVQRTGIRERRIAGPGESTLTFARAAAAEALRDSGVPATDIDLILTATITPDHPLPSTACELQAALGCGWVPSFDLAAACSGFVYGMVTAAQYVHMGLAKNALVVGAECLSHITDMEDRSTAILFGDGAGAAVLRRSTDPARRILAARLGSDGQRAMAIWVPAGGSAEPASTRTVNERLHYMRMKGREIYKFAVTQFCELFEKTLEDVGATAAEVKLLIPHQSNLRIMESACERLAFPLERVMVNIDRYGNTSAASIPLALHEALRAGRINRGDLVMMVAFGAGLTWGSLLVRV